MYMLFILAFIFVTTPVFSQNDAIKKLDIRIINKKFDNAQVDIIVKSKKGDELVEKPIILFIQGSLPKPLIVFYDSVTTYPIFPFKVDSLLNDYHFVTIGKPSIPLFEYQKNLMPDMSFKDAKTNVYPTDYVLNNNLSYYVRRNKFIIKFLQQQLWVSKNKFIVAGHSEGSTIGAKLASECSAITHLVYISGNPFGRIATEIAKARKYETDSNNIATGIFNTWSNIVSDSKNEIQTDVSDTKFSAYEFSIPPINYLRKLKIPVLVVYGTKDFSALFNDYLQTETLKEKKTNFTYKAYIGLEHNFFPLHADGRINYDIFGWNKVGAEILKWLK